MPAPTCGDPHWCRAQGGSPFGPASGDEPELRGGGRVAESVSRSKDGLRTRRAGVCHGTGPGGAGRADPGCCPPISGGARGGCRTRRTSESPAALQECGTEPRSVGRVGSTSGPAPRGSCFSPLPEPRTRAGRGCGGGPGLGQRRACRCGLQVCSPVSEWGTPGCGARMDGRPSSPCSRTSLEGALGWAQEGRGLRAAAHALPCPLPADRGAWLPQPAQRPGL